MAVQLVRMTWSRGMVVTSQILFGDIVTDRIQIFCYIYYLEFIPLTKYPITFGRRRYCFEILSETEFKSFVLYTIWSSYLSPNIQFKLSLYPNVAVLVARRWCGIRLSKWDQCWRSVDFLRAHNNDHHRPWTPSYFQTLHGTLLIVSPHHVTLHIEELKYG